MELISQNNFSFDYLVIADMEIFRQELVEYLLASRCVITHGARRCSAANLKGGMTVSSFNAVWF